MKYEDLKCEFCDGHGEREKNIDGADCPVICGICEGTGIDNDQVSLLSTVKRLQEENEQLKAWKESEIALWRPLLDYFHKEDKLLKLGVSIVEEALHRSKFYVRVQEELLCGNKSAEQLEQE